MPGYLDNRALQEKPKSVMECSELAPICETVSEYTKLLGVEIINYKAIIFICRRKYSSNVVNQQIGVCIVQSMGYHLLFCFSRFKKLLPVHYSLLKCT